MKHNKQGFSIVETMVAITVLLIAVVAPMSLAADGVRAARLAQDQIVAFYMAQEAIELVKNARDNNKIALTGTNQLTGLEDCSYDTSTGGTQRYCYIDPLDPQVPVECSGRNCPALGRINQGVGENEFWLYTYQLGSQPTKYVRDISVWYVDPVTGDKTSTPGEEAVVEVRVVWPFVDGTSKEHVVRNVLTAW